MNKNDLKEILRNVELPEANFKPQKAVQKVHIMEEFENVQQQRAEKKSRINRLFKQLSVAGSFALIALVAVIGTQNIGSNNDKKKEVFAQAANTYENLADDGRYFYSRIEMNNQIDGSQSRSTIESWVDQVNGNTKNVTINELGEIVDVTLEIDGQGYVFTNTSASQDLYSSEFDGLPSAGEKYNSLDFIPNAQEAGITLDELNSLSEADLDAKLAAAGFEPYFLNTFYGCSVEPPKIYYLSNEEFEAALSEGSEDLFSENMFCIGDETIEATEFGEQDIELVSTYDALAKIATSGNSKEKQKLFETLANSSYVAIEESINNWNNYQVFAFTIEDPLLPDELVDSNLFYIDRASYALVGVSSSFIDPFTDNKTKLEAIVVDYYATNDDPGFNLNLYRNDSYFNDEFSYEIITPEETIKQLETNLGQ